MKLKEGVRIVGVKPELLIGLMVAEQIFLEHGSELVVTSIIDGKHKQKSKHYSGNAADLRIWYLDDAQKTVEDLQKALGDDFVVILESDHIHMHYEPKEPY